MTTVNTQGHQPAWSQRGEETHVHDLLAQSEVHVLDASANRLAHYLRMQGVGPGFLVAISLERGLPMLVGLLGILKAGGAYLPLDSA
jgi:non-ribosomal peptide synthetase component F